MKKVALVFDGLGFGGIERVGVDYAKLFHNIGYDVSIYNLRPDLTEMPYVSQKDAILITAGCILSRCKTLVVGQICLSVRVCCK